ncbi:APC family permease [Bradyrhizobium liaoningense]|uniref:APC family permease n=1 Tax=Bradyrhizobium liaoningense TaxID=43992 RepID=UPI001BACB94C|nr:APC family permease [Bradyrhizobium liaoningense]MBR0988035.1 APC family permease [Bradyrhizobium liaoningense]
MSASESANLTATGMDCATNKTELAVGGASISMTDRSRLRSGVLGTADILFMVVAVAAPMAVVVATMPLAFALGNGPGAVGIYAAVAAVMALFAVGYVRLLPHVRNAGAFYAIISNGFGASVGLSAAFVALASYVSLCCATLGALAYFVADLLGRSNIRTSWVLVALSVIFIVAVLSYFRITLAARILGAVLVGEVLLLLALDVAIVISTGGNLPMGVFAPNTVISPGLGIAAMYAFNSCIGFEGTAIYQEEARDRERTIPRATYAAIAVIGLFYIFTAWCLTAAAGTENIATLSGKDPGHFVASITARYLGSAAEGLLSLLVVTSAFAAVLGLFNNSARYIFALARDRAFPQALGRTNAYGAPFAAGLPVLLVLMGVAVPFWMADLDPLLVLATSLTGLGSVGLMILLGATSFSIASYFTRRHQIGCSTVFAPILAGMAIFLGVGLTLDNYKALTGVNSAIINRLPWGLLLLAALGMARGLWLRSCLPDRHARLGSTRMDDLT